jgi:hypothetical protein
MRSIRPGSGAQRLWPKEVGLSRAGVHHFWYMYDLQPRRVEHFKFSAAYGGEAKSSASKGSVKNSKQV